MKKISLSLSLMTFVFFAFSQKIDKSQVPETVKKMLEVKMNDTLTPAWEKVGEDFLASFTKGEMKGQVFINSKGEWQKTVWILPYQYVPQKIKDHVHKAYEGFKVVKASIQYRTDGDFYVIEAKKKKVAETLLYNLKSEFVKSDTPGEVKK
jgi:hypothetical protein